jgi:hypothetical protein
MDGLPPLWVRAVRYYELVHELRCDASAGWGQGRCGGHGAAIQCGGTRRVGVCDVRRVTAIIYEISCMLLSASTREVKHLQKHVPEI